MLRCLVGIGAGWFIYTKTGRHLAKNICINLLPYVEKEIGIPIVKPLKELMKDKTE